MGEENMEALPAKRPPGEPLPSTSCGEEEVHLALAGPGNQSAESLGRAPGAWCLMEPLLPWVLGLGISRSFRVSPRALEPSAPQGSPQFPAHRPGYMPWFFS